MVRPGGPSYTAPEWWRALLTFTNLTGWRISEILALRRDDVNLAAGTAFLAAESTKGKRDVHAELHPIVLDHLRVVLSFDPMVFPWPSTTRRLWADFAKFKTEAAVDFLEPSTGSASVCQRQRRPKATSTKLGGCGVRGLLINSTFRRRSRNG